MPAAKRVYMVTEEGKESAKLVRASTPSQAIRHAVRNSFKAAPASQDDLIRVLGTGATVEDAGEDAGE